jgi:hypothetical protein
VKASGGRAPGGSRDKARLWGRTARDVGNVQIRFPSGALKEIRIGDRIVVYPTGRPEEPYVAARWIAGGPDAFDEGAEEERSIRGAME